MTFLADSGSTIPNTRVHWQGVANQDRLIPIPHLSTTKTNLSLAVNSTYIFPFSLEVPLTINKIISEVVTAGGAYDIEIYRAGVAPDGTNPCCTTVLLSLLTHSGSIAVNTRTFTRFTLEPGSNFLVITGPLTAPPAMRGYAATQLIAMGSSSGAGAALTCYRRSGTTQGVAGQLTNVPLLQADLTNFGLPMTLFGNS